MAGEPTEPAEPVEPAELTEAAATGEPAEPTAPADSVEPDEPAEPIEPTEQAEPDWKAKSRHWESRAKANKAKADEKDVEIASLRAQLERQTLVADTAREKGVDASLLARMAGDTADEVAANADALLAWARESQGYPDVPDNGAGRPSPVTRDQIMAEKDPVKRAQLMGAHKELFIQ